MTEQSPVIYLAWQDTVRTRRWFVVGRLRRLGGQGYEFVYTRGYEEARRVADMQPILGFMESNRRYLSEKLFPLFQNRLMSPGREEYATHLERLGLRREASGAPPEPLQILARSGGSRTTDSFEVFPAPQKVGPSGGPRSYRISFFVRGIRYVPSDSQARASRCAPGERLLLLADWQNPHDEQSVMLRTEKDNHLLGWVPRYYSGDIHALRERGLPIEVRVERVNPAASAPSWQRLLCRLEAPWPEDFRAFEAPEYEPLVHAECEAAGFEPTSHM
jgi:hypothetical protein